MRGKEHVFDPRGAVRRKTQEETQMKRVPSIQTTAQDRSPEQDLLEKYLPLRGWKVLSSEPGFIRWKGAKAEGVARVTSSRVWQLLADPAGRWDRCANALVRMAILRFSVSALDSLFARMQDGVAQFPKDKRPRVGCAKRQRDPSAR
jgi:hypothetical protein